MLEMYRTELETNVTEKTAKYEKGNWINMISPTEEEINDVCNNLKIKEDFIRYALDYEEKARIDIEEDDDTILFIIDIPIREREGDSLIYSTMPIGIIFVRDDYIITVSLKKNEITPSLKLWWLSPGAACSRSPWNRPEPRYWRWTASPTAPTTRTT